MTIHSFFIRWKFLNKRYTFKYKNKNKKKHTTYYIHFHEISVISIIWMVVFMDAHQQGFHEKKIQFSNNNRMYGNNKAQNTVRTRYKCHVWETSCTIECLQLNLLSISAKNKNVVEGNKLEVEMCCIMPPCEWDEREDYLKWMMAHYLTASAI